MNNKQTGASQPSSGAQSMAPAAPKLQGAVSKTGSLAQPKLLKKKVIKTKKIISKPGQSIVTKSSNKVKKSSVDPARPQQSQPAKSANSESRNSTQAHPVSA